MGWSCICGEAHDDTVGRCWSCDRARSTAVQRKPDPPRNRVDDDPAPPPRDVVTTNVVASSISSVSAFPLLPDETVLTSHGGRALVVTTCRVRSYAETLNQTSVTSIMLEEVASCSVLALSKPWMLVVSGLVLVASLAVASGRDKTWIAGLFVAVGFAIAYFITLRRVVSIGSAGATINVDLEGSTESAIQVIDTIEKAKAARNRR